MNRKHLASFLMESPSQPTPGTLPEGHLAKINAKQSTLGKPNLKEENLIARPILLFGNQMTSYYTRIPDHDLVTLASQINESGGPLLSAHMTDTTPIGTFYMAEVVPGEQDGELVLNTWAYWVKNSDGLKLAEQIDAGIINEASIGYWYTEALCSITGGDYAASPYYAGETYKVKNPQTGEEEEKLCFIWTTGEVEFVEGSLVYRGAYPGTKVGSDTASFQFSAPSLQTRFQMAASREMLEVHSKTRPRDAEPIKPEQKESSMKITLKLNSGAVKEVEPEKVQALLNEEIKLAEDRGKQQVVELHAEALGLQPKDISEENLHKTRKLAEDGKKYRSDLLEELGSLTLAIEGNSDPDVGERVKKAYNNLNIEDIRKEVVRLRAKRDDLVPNTKQSINSEEDNPVPALIKPDFDSV